MKAQKYAFLLDLDGPFFDNDLVQVAMMNIFKCTPEQWNSAYEKSRKGTSYVDYGNIILLLSRKIGIQTGAMWDILYEIMKEEQFFPQKNKEALTQLLRLGHCELVTQGYIPFQDLKLSASGTKTLFESANKQKGEGHHPHSIKITPHDKSLHLRARLKGLVEEGYTHVFQFDDRVGPLSDLQKFAEQQGLGGHLYQARIHTGKHGKVPNPDYHLWMEFSSTWEALQHLRLDLLPRTTPEGAHIQSARMRR